MCAGMRGKAHQALEDVVDALVVVTKSGGGVGVGALSRCQNSQKGGDNDQRYLESCDIAILPLWQYRRGCLDGGICGGICSTTPGEVEINAQVGRSSSTDASPSTSIFSSLSCRRFSLSMRSRSRSCVSNVFKFFVLRLKFLV